MFVQQSHEDFTSCSATLGLEDKEKPTVGMDKYFESSCIAEQEAWQIIVTIDRSYLCTMCNAINSAHARNLECNN